MTLLTYTPPLKDMGFVLNEMLDACGTLRTLPVYADVDSALMTQVIEQAGRFASEVLAPLNAIGDAQGCQWADGDVTTPEGFARAYRQFQRAGWPALACRPEHGGQGLPNVLNCILYEMLSAANHAWTMFPGLLHGAYACLHQHASPEIKARYLPKLASGQWLATMALTEPQAGSDLGLLRTRAVMQPDGSARISGSKIFISGGEQDWTENIVHLVLARLPDAPAGSKGVSLFLVPKFLPDDNGRSGDGLGVRNAVWCTGLEHKMGIHGSATASLQFDEATGWLIGQPHRGLAAMFVMMNAARLHVGMQGLGLADTAYQQALAYARQREQMRAVRRSNRAADPIILHPPVQRLLMTQRAWVEGGRMLCYQAALLLDIAEHHEALEERTAAHGLLALLTPLIKSLMSEQGFVGASQALQVFGGHGYVRETGIEQLVRDARIAMIYEGTNEIQAIDLLLRKVLADQGAVLNHWLDRVLEQVQDDSVQAERLRQLVQEVRTITQAIAQASQQDAALPHVIASDYLRLLAHVGVGGCWLQAAACARRSLANHPEKDPAFYTAKLNTAAYYFDFILPETRQRLLIIHHALAASQNGGNDFLPDVLPDTL